MRQMFHLGIGAVLGVGLLLAQASRTAEVELKAVQHQADVEGDLKGAINGYSALITKYKSYRNVVAMALVRMGDCYQKLGDAKARGIYEEVVKDYADQREAAAAARARLGDNARDRTGAEPAAQRVWAAEEAGTGFFSALSAEVSPDGQRVVFADWKNGNVAVRDMKTGEIRFLTHGAGEGHAQDLLFSPDGKQVAYRRAGALEAEPIRVVGVDGSQVRSVAVREYGMFLFAWSPDGKQIAASQYNSGDKTWALLLLNVANGSTTRLKSTGWAPPPKIGGFSPDGKFLVYSLAKGRSRGQNGTFILAVDGSRETKLIEGTADYSDPRWTPDGRGVVFLSDRSGTRDLWLIQVTGGKPMGEPELIKAQVGAIDLKNFTRDGSLYYGTNQLESDLYQIVFDPRGRPADTPTRIVDKLVGTNYEPALSPDGKLLAFFRGTPGVSDLRPAALVVRSNITGEENELLAGVSANYQGRYVRWYPDSRSLLLEEDKQGRTSFQRVEVDTRKAHAVFEGDGGIWSHAELSRDGRTLFYSSRIAQPNSLGSATSRLIRRDLVTGQEAELYRMESRAAGFFGISLSPDMRRLAFMADVHGNRALMTIPEAGGEAREIYKAPEVSGDQEGLHWYGACWTADGRYILVTRSATSEKRQDELVAFPVEGGEPRVLAVMPQITNPSVSPDGRHVLFTRARWTRELWVMRNFLPQLQVAR